jgi:hypothetical protein
MNAMSHQAKLDGPTPAQQQALVLHWLQAEVQGSTGKPGDKPSIARLKEQHMKTTGRATNRQEVLNQPQQQDLASRFPLTKGACRGSSVNLCLARPTAAAF